MFSLKLTNASNISFVRAGYILAVYFFFTHQNYYKVPCSWVKRERERERERGKKNHTFSNILYFLPPQSYMTSRHSIPSPPPSWPFLRPSLCRSPVRFGRHYLLLSQILAWADLRRGSVPSRRYIVPTSTPVPCYVPTCLGKTSGQKSPLK